MFRRVLAVLVLVIVAIVAIRIAFGIVAGLVTAVLWIGVVVALVAATLWARSTLKGAKRNRAVKRGPGGTVAAAPAEDPIEAEMRKINEQLREQGRR
jgi:uncharacterized protein (DUF58 family)